MILRKIGLFICLWLFFVHHECVALAPTYQLNFIHGMEEREELGVPSALTDRLQEGNGLFSENMNATESYRSHSPEKAIEKKKHRFELSDIFQFMMLFLTLGLNGVSLCLSLSFTALTFVTRSIQEMTSSVPSVSSPPPSPPSSPTTHQTKVLPPSAESGGKTESPEESFYSYLLGRLTLQELKQVLSSSTQEQKGSVLSEALMQYFYLADEHQASQQSLVNNLLSFIRDPDVRGEINSVAQQGELSRSAYFVWQSLRQNLATELGIIFLSTEEYGMFLNWEIPANQPLTSYRQDSEISSYVNYEGDEVGGSGSLTTELWDFRLPVTANRAGEARLAIYNMKLRAQNMSGPWYDAGNRMQQQISYDQAYYPWEEQYQYFMQQLNSVIDNGSEAFLLRNRYGQNLFSESAMLAIKQVDGSYGLVILPSFESINQHPTGSPNIFHSFDVWQHPEVELPRSFLEQVQAQEETVSLHILVNLFAQHPTFQIKMANQGLTSFANIGAIHQGLKIIPNAIATDASGESILKSGAYINLKWRIELLSKKILILEDNVDGEDLEIVSDRLTELKSSLKALKSQIPADSQTVHLDFYSGHSEEILKHEQTFQKLILDVRGEYLEGERDDIDSLLEVLEDPYESPEWERFENLASQIAEVAQKEEYTLTETNSLGKIWSQLASDTSASGIQMRVAVLEAVLEGKISANDYVLALDKWGKEGASHHIETLLRGDNSSYYGSRLVNLLSQHGRESALDVMKDHAEYIEVARLQGKDGTEVSLNLSNASAEWYLGSWIRGYEATEEGDYYVYTFEGEDEEEITNLPDTFVVAKEETNEPFLDIKTIPLYGYRVERNRIMDQGILSTDFTANQDWYTNNFEATVVDKAVKSYTYKNAQGTIITEREPSYKGELVKITLTDHGALVDGEHGSVYPYEFAEWLTVCQSDGTRVLMYNPTTHEEVWIDDTVDLPLLEVEEVPTDMIYIDTYHETITENDHITDHARHNIFYSFSSKTVFIQTQYLIHDAVTGTDKYHTSFFKKYDSIKNFYLSDAILVMESLSDRYRIYDLRTGSLSDPVDKVSLYTGYAPEWLELHRNTDWTELMRADIVGSTDSTHVQAITGVFYKKNSHKYSLGFWYDETIDEFIVSGISVDNKKIVYLGKTPDKTILVYDTVNKKIYKHGTLTETKIKEMIGQATLTEGELILPEDVSLPSATQLFEGQTITGMSKAGSGWQVTMSSGKIYSLGGKGEPELIGVMAHWVTSHSEDLKKSLRSLIVGESLNVSNRIILFNDEGFKGWYIEGLDVIVERSLFGTEEKNLKYLGYRADPKRIYFIDLLTGDLYDLYEDSSNSWQTDVLGTYGFVDVIESNESQISDRLLMIRGKENVRDYFSLPLLESTNYMLMSGEGGSDRYRIDYSGWHHYKEIIIDDHLPIGVQESSYPSLLIFESNVDTNNMQVGRLGDDLLIVDGVTETRLIFSGVLKEGDIYNPMTISYRDDYETTLLNLIEKVKVATREDPTVFVPAFEYVLETPTPASSTHKEPILSRSKNLSIMVFSWIIYGVTTILLIIFFYKRYKAWRSKRRLKVNLSSSRNESDWGREEIEMRGYRLGVRNGRHNENETVESESDLKSHVPTELTMDCRLEMEVDFEVQSVSSSIVGNRSTTELIRSEEPVQLEAQVKGDKPSFFKRKIKEGLFKKKTQVEKQQTETRLSVNEPRSLFQVFHAHEWRKPLLGGKLIQSA